MEVIEVQFQLSFDLLVYGFPVLGESCIIRQQAKMLPVVGLSPDGLLIVGPAKVAHHQN